MSISDTEAPPRATAPQIEVERVKCDSCGFTEECTVTYILRICQRYQGRWLCGLCIEAVKDEVIRSDSLISIEEALHRHIHFCKNFRPSNPQLPEQEHPIFAIGRVLRRRLDSHRPIRSNSSVALSNGVEEKRVSPLRRSESCFSSISS